MWNGLWGQLNGIGRWSVMLCRTVEMFMYRIGEPHCVTVRFCILCKCLPHIAKSNFSTSQVVAEEVVNAEF